MSNIVFMGTPQFAVPILKKINHLDGKLIIDYLSKIKKDLIIKKLSKKKNSSRVVV